MAGEQQRGTQSRVGSLVRGKYRIDAFISKGSMAAVYEASHRNGTKVALKVLHAVYSKDESLRTRFLREGYLANSVEHPGTVKVVDDDITEDGCAFLVMELLRGETLEQWRVKSGGRAPLEEALAVADQLLAVLEAAHKKGIVHRDLKPENVFVTDEGTLKVLDWGVANVWDGQKSSEMTGTGMVLGTPAFMPPEQALGKRNEVDAQSDLWAIGATLFMLLAGESVHPGGDAVAKLVATARKPARSLRVVAPDVPDAVVAAVDRSLAFKKVDRFANATEMREAFANALPKARHYGDSQDDEPTLFARAPSEMRSEPNTERHLQAADAHHEEQGPITLDRPTERGRKKALADSAPPPTEVPVTRAPHTSPMPLGAISLPTPGSSFEPPSATSRMRHTNAPHPFTQTAALPAMRGPMSSNPGSPSGVGHPPMSTPRSSTQPVPSMHAGPAGGPSARPEYRSDMRADMAPPELAPAYAPSELAGMPLPNDRVNGTGPHARGGRSKGLLIALASVIVLVAGAGLVVNKRRAAVVVDPPLTALPSAQGSAHTAALTSPSAIELDQPGDTNAGAGSATPAGSVAADTPPTAAAGVDAGLAIAAVASLEPKPRPRPRPAQPPPSAAPDNPENPTTQPSATAAPPPSAGSDPANTPPARTAEPAPEKTVDPPKNMPEKIPPMLPDDPN